ncbi:ABC transporter permease [Candidatus Bathyarchaeota archaeon]|nr:ABC transporter permease [Candidatus Bathyarchaeota archaeon]
MSHVSTSHQLEKRNLVVFEILRYLFENQSFLIFGSILFLLIIIAIFAPFISPYDPLRQNLVDRLKPPSIQYLMGTDQFGRDILSRVIYGSRTSLTVAVCSISLAAIIGVFLGIIAGYIGGKVDTIISRIMDVMFAFPAVVLAIAIMAALGPGIINVILVIVFVSTPQFVRISRGSALAEKEKPYVLAARSVGISSLRIMFRHILPNTLSPTIVQFTVLMAWAILTEAALSFIGVGIRPPEPSWGFMLNEARNYILTGQWWMILFPGLAITISALTFNFLGDTLRDALDPRIRRREKVY